MFCGDQKERSIITCSEVLVVTDSVSWDMYLNFESEGEGSFIIPSPLPHFQYKFTFYIVGS